MANHVTLRRHEAIDRGLRRDALHKHLVGVVEGEHQHGVAPFVRAAADVRHGRDDTLVATEHNQR